MVFLMRPRWNKRVLKLCIALVASTIFIGEYLVYFISASTWNLPIPSSEDDLKVLFLSDPQIQGFKFESQGVIGHITRWDACNYLRKTFSIAVSAFKPDVIVILGDLLDEGYVASEETFFKYKDWFEEIYQVPKSVKRILLAGDNDVGGEAEALDVNVLARHEKYFGAANQIVKFKNWQFLKLNTLSFLHDYQWRTTLGERQTFNNLKTFALSSVKKLDNDKHTVILSHLPVFFWDSQFALKILTNLTPRVIFTGHVHKASYRTYKSKDFSAEEHIVPTCSYRMGTVHMGIGVAVFGKDGSFQYSMLKLPARYPYLYLYLAVSLLSLLCILVFFRIS